MRIQHATQTASGLPTDDAGKMRAKIVIVEEVERRWRIWNGKARNARRPACRNFAYRGNRKLSRQSTNEQIAADALVPKRCRSPASGSLRGLQWNAQLRIGPPISAAC